MKHDEAIKKIRDFVKTASRRGVPGTIETLAALDQLNPEPSEDAWELARELAVLDESPYARCSDAYFNDAAALITAHDERIRRECIDGAESKEGRRG